MPDTHRRKQYAPSLSAAAPVGTTSTEPSSSFSSLLYPVLILEVLVERLLSLGYNLFDVTNTSNTEEVRSCRAKSNSRLTDKTP